MSSISSASPVRFAAQAEAPTSHSAAPHANISRARLWTSYGMSGLVSAFLLFDTAMKLLQVEPAMKGTAELGWPVSTLFGIGVVELLCVLAYVLPRTSVLGAVLLTGYLGGAVATHVRVGNPLFSHVLFPIYMAALIWGGLYLRDAAVRALLERRPR
jgi:hypothetical protein